MIPELGLLLLIMAAAASFLSLGSVVYHNENLQIRALRLANISVMMALGVLAYSFYTVDLSVQAVYDHADQALPVLYRIGAVWGGHEGSMLLWLSILNIWIFAASCFVSQEVRRQTLWVLAAVNLGFLSFLLVSSNPFARYLPITPISGQDLNPFLQDPVMLIHPPILYMGYLGFVLPFALAVAMLWQGQSNPSVMRLIRQSVLIAWSFLTVGIALGSFWAYYELGWGGWWFWDPVENASLMPWLAGCALLHMIHVSQKRQGFIPWTLLLCIIAFGLSILGTFLVRSGALTSVHSFANDPTRGLFILCLLAIFILPALMLYSMRSGRLHHPMTFSLSSREGMMVINNVLLMIVLSTVILGTLYPLIIESLGLGFISVGAPYFNTLLVPLGFLIGFFILISPMSRYILPMKPSFSARSLSMHLGHFGFLLFVLGATVTSLMSHEEDVVLKVGQAHAVQDYRFVLESITPIQGPNYLSTQADVTVEHQGKFLSSLKPEKRFYTTRNMPIAQIALEGNLFRDIYLALAEPISSDEWVLRIQIKPMIRLIWLGALIMAMAGLLALRNGSKGEKS